MQTPSWFSASSGVAQTDLRHEEGAAAAKWRAVASQNQAHQKGLICTSAIGPCGALPRPGDPALLGFESDRGLGT